MASDPTDLIRRLAGGLRAFAGGPVVGATAPEQWQDFTRRALDHVGIETNKAQFERAWRTLWAARVHGRQLHPGRQGDLGSNPRRTHPGEQIMSTTLTAKDFETVYDDNHTFPFFEDENGYGIYRYGHIDKVEFARLIGEYDALSQFGPDDEITADDVNHVHAKVIEVDDLDYEWRLEFADQSPDTIPVTWVQR